jgi:hypothetical protein
MTGNSKNKYCFCLIPRKARVIAENKVTIKPNNNNELPENNLTRSNNVSGVAG